MQAPQEKGTAGHKARSCCLGFGRGWSRAGQGQPTALFRLERVGC